MKKFFKKLFWGVLYLIGIYAVAYTASTMIDNNGSFVFSPIYLADSNTLMIFFVGSLCLFVILLMKWDGKKKDKSSGGSWKGKDTSGKTTDQYYDKKWMSDKELDTKHNHCTMETLKDMPKDGILIRAEKKGKTIHINYVDPIHTLIIGTTGSGKSTQYLEPFVQIMSRTKARPSFIISDPKGDILDHNYENLKEHGYDIKILDLAEPFSSMKWNPMENAYNKYKMAQHIEEMLFVHQAGDKVDTDKMVKTQDFNEEETSWYEFNKHAYINQQLLFSDMEVKKKELIDEAQNDLSDFVSTIATVEDKTQPGWERGARSYILGIALAMLEDSDDERLGMTKEKFNPYNLYKICNHIDTSGRDPRASLKKYIDGRSKFSKVAALCSPVLTAAEGTMKSYMSIVSEKMAPFSDMGVCLLTSKTEINFREIPRKPSAFFIKIPDYIHTRDPIATICFTQIYKQLVEEAISFQKPGTMASLKRHVYFLLDEFANLPKFPDFGPTISVARSRGIFYVMAIQSYSQLDSRYGKEDSQTIYNNTPITVYMGSDDHETNETFSKKLGNRTIEMTDKSTSSGGGSDKKSTSESKKAVSIPLIDAQELPTVNNATANDPAKNKLIISYYRFKDPVKATFTPYFYAKDIYNVRAPKIPYTPNVALDEEHVYYDIVERNRIVLGNTSNDDDDDFDFFK